MERASLLPFLLSSRLPKNRRMDEELLYIFVGHGRYLGAMSERKRERERGRRGESRKTFFSASIINLLFVAFGREFRMKNKSVKGYLSLRSK